MNLFNYLMAKKGHNTSVRDDLFSYLLGKRTPKEIKTATGTTISISDVTSEKIVSLTLSKESSQETTSGKNQLNNYDLNYSYSNVGSQYNNFTTIDTGIRYNSTWNTGNPVAIFKMFDLTPYIGKTIRMKATFNDGGSIRIGRIKEDGRTITNAVETNVSNTVISFNVPDDLGEYPYLFYSLRIYLSTTDTVDFTNLIITIDNENMTYEEYTGGQPSPNPDYSQEVKTVKGNVGITITDGTNTRNYTIPLGNNEICGIGDYKDELIVDKNGHCWLNKKTGKVVLNGSENWSRDSGNAPFVINIANSLITTSNSALPNILINNFQKQSYNGSWQINDYLACAAGVSYPHQLRFRNTSVSTLEDWENWLTTHETIVYYALETQQLIDLNYTVDLTLFEGVNNISNSDDMNMTLEYY